jgi:CRISPR-associated Csx3 family protein
MELKVSENGDITLVEIQKNGGLVNAQNPVTPDELGNIEFPDLSGKGLIVSGMPVWASATVCLKFKNTFKWVSTLDPRLNGGVVVHSVDRDIRVGQVIPLG